MPDFGRAARVAAHRSTSGAVVDLGFVGDPVDADAVAPDAAPQHGYVPVIASLGVDDETADVLNVNADVMACRIAAALAVERSGDRRRRRRACSTRRVESIARLDSEAIDRLIADGTATAGMIAKLSACRAALVDGVASIRWWTAADCGHWRMSRRPRGRRSTAQPAWVQR